MDRNMLLTLLKKESYPDYIVDATIEKIEKFQPSILDAFKLWISDGKTPDFSVEGYAFSDLIKQYDMKPVGAFLTLDWLLREPEKASHALKRGIR